MIPLLRLNEPLRRFSGPASIALAFVALTRWSWKKWPDVAADFGHQLYIPWQILRGKVLYGDMDYIFGPLSQYFNALWFSLAGVSFHTLVVVNLVLLALLTSLIYLYFRDACDRPTATTTALAFLGLFGFSQYRLIGNFNFVCPYAHEAAHGTVLTVALLLCLRRYAAGRKPWLAALAGTLLGAAFLTKPEVFLAAGAAAALEWVRLSRSDAAGTAPARKGHLTLFGATALLPPTAFFLYFSGRMPLAQAFRGTAGAVAPFAAAGSFPTKFYLWCTGLDHPWANAARMAAIFAVAAALVLTVSFLCRVLHERGVASKPVNLLLAALLFGLVAACRTPLLSVEFSRALPLTTLAALAVFAGKIGTSPAAGLLGWSVVSLAFLLKMFLNARLHQYGFYLAMPAVLTLVVLLVWRIPDALDRRGGGGALFRSLATAAVLGGVAVCLMKSNDFYRAKTFPVGRGADNFLAFHPALDGRTSETLQAVEYIESATPEGSTLLVLPDGLLLNYLARRTNPTRLLHPLLNPSAYLETGEDAVIGLLERDPPGFVIVKHMDLSIFGYGIYGADPRGGRKTLAWVNERYETVKAIVNEPARFPSLGMDVRRRREPRPDGVRGGDRTPGTPAPRRRDVD